MGRSVKDKTINKKRSICEVHRQIYDAVNDAAISDEEKEKIVDLLEEAYTYGKKMDLKLQQYKHNWSDGWWKKNRKFKVEWDKKKE